jgi:hypothetical protein
MGRMKDENIKLLQMGFNMCRKCRVMTNTELRGDLCPACYKDEHENLPLPLVIPGFGMVDSRGAFETFCKHYAYLGQAMANLRTHTEMLEALQVPFPIELLVRVEGGVVTGIYSPNGNLLKVYLLDIDNLKANEKEKIGTEIIIVETPIVPLLEIIQYTIEGEGHIFKGEA